MRKDTCAWSFNIHLKTFLDLLSVLGLGQWAKCVKQVSVKYYKYIWALLAFQIERVLKLDNLFRLESCTSRPGLVFPTTGKGGVKWEGVVLYEYMTTNETLLIKNLTIWV